MIITTNMDAMKSLRSLNNNTRKTDKNMEKLSSGMKINRAADDSAGLVISTKMRAQIRGLAQDERNIDDGISMFNVAEGGMSNIEGMIHRIRELAVQSASDTNTDDDRAKMQEEVKQLIEGIDRIASDTEFNTHNVLLGEVGFVNKTVTTTTNQTLTNIFRSKISYADSVNVGMQDSYHLGTLYTLADIGNNSGATASSSSFSVKNTTDNQTYNTGYRGIDAYILDFDSNFANFLTTADANDPDAAQHFIDAVADGMNRALDAAGYTSLPDIKGYVLDDGHLGLYMGNEYAITFGGCSNQAYPSIAHTYLHEGFAGGGTANISIPTTSTTQVASETSVPNEYVIQVGPNTDQNILFKIPPMPAKVVGEPPDKVIANADVSTRPKANDTIALCDIALDYVNSGRALMGAHVNRLESAKSNATNYHENLSNAESRIRDIDMSKEMTEQVKNNILMQSATAMLAQANQRPESILQLLR